MESRAAGLDAAITAVAGSALLAAPLLGPMPLAPLVPISDSLLVILLAALVGVEPTRQFRRALGQTAGAAGDPALIPPVRTRLEALLEDADGGGTCSLLDLSLLKMDRTTFLVAYLDPHGAVDGRWMDALRERVQAGCAELLGPLRTELILTSRPPFHSPQRTLNLRAGPRRLLCGPPRPSGGAASEAAPSGHHEKTLPCRQQQHEIPVQAQQALAAGEHGGDEPAIADGIAWPSDEGLRGVKALCCSEPRPGVHMGWMMLPQERAVGIWRGGSQGMAERLDNASRVDGDELAEGAYLQPLTSQGERILITAHQRGQGRERWRPTATSATLPRQPC